MARIKPFAAIRYDEAVVGELSKVTSPPYDVISPEDRVYYHKLHPNNFVRLVLGEELPTDNESDNRFTRAGRYLDDWLASGALKQDAEPSIFVYQQIWQSNGESKSVRGFTCAVKLADYSEEVILPHEWTLARPKSDLAVLIRQVKANLDCVYGLYADLERVLDKVMDRAMDGKPTEEAIDKNGVINRFWAVTDAAEIGKVQAFLADKQIAIADGHHRYETALAYRDEMREATGCPSTSSGCAGECEFDYLMMTLINVYEKDMTIYPTHRVLANLSEDALASLDAKLTECFEVRASSKGTLIEDMAREGAIGMYHTGGAMILKPRPGTESLLSGSQASRKLELNVLHKLILEKHLGIDDEKLRNQANIIYTRDPAEAFKLVDSGERQIAFLLNHIAVKSVLDIAAAGEKMPQKATYFYPKLLSGLALRKLD
jgi:uncharacterized protein (DUF1015 family)